MTLAESTWGRAWAMDVYIYAWMIAEEYICTCKHTHTPMSECVAPMSECVALAAAMNGSTLNSLQLFCSASLTFQLWRSWHALGSMTRQLHVEPPVHSLPPPLPCAQHRFAERGAGSTEEIKNNVSCFRSFVTDHSSSRPPACHSHAL